MRYPLQGPLGAPYWNAHAHSYTQKVANSRLAAYKRPDKGIDLKSAEFPDWRIKIDGEASTCERLDRR
ncbi:hypothetical protein MPC4_340010 [Methylocella tundrae]|uniref:Uncharacterized protein n=1 Tax=Methylocella tundrae TaxID=227605 RepID=A0A8B6MB12_METTU|nr:hypothetical protein MPC4_340010 [Methylocella tundrae]